MTPEVDTLTVEASRDTTFNTALGLDLVKFLTQHRFLTKKECGLRAKDFEIGLLLIIIQYLKSKYINAVEKKPNNFLFV